MTRSDQKIITNLKEHAEIMQRLQADFPELSRDAASEKALAIMQGKETYPADREEVKP